MTPQDWLMLLSLLFNGILTLVNILRSRRQEVVTVQKEEEEVQGVRLDNTLKRLDLMKKMQATINEQGVMLMKQKERIVALEDAVRDLVQLLRPIAPVQAVQILRRLDITDLDEDEEKRDG